MLARFCLLSIKNSVRNINNLLNLMFLKELNLMNILLKLIKNYLKLRNKILMKTFLIGGVDNIYKNTLWAALRQ